jgi:hypothetical protein
MIKFSGEHQAYCTMRDPRGFYVKEIPASFKKVGDDRIWSQNRASPRMDRPTIFFLGFSGLAFGET